MLGEKGEERGAKERERERREEQRRENEGRERYYIEGRECKCKRERKYAFICVVLIQHAWLAINGQSSLLAFTCNH